MLSILCNTAHVIRTTVVSPTGSRPPSRNRNNEMPGDEELGFEAAVAALGRTWVSYLVLVFKPSASRPCRVIHVSSSCLLQV